MSLQVAVGTYVVVHAMSVYLLRASGVWAILFGPILSLTPEKTHDPLRQAPRGWIENHAFWDLAEEAPPEADAEVAFWGNREAQAG
ncbi:MAG: hypothetical protein ACR2PK_17440 [Acidimicrobiales bacterium]